MGRGPARPIKIAEDGPRPGPAHHTFKLSRPGPARPIKFSKVSARPGPAHHIFKRLGPVRPGPSQFSDRPGLARPKQTAHGKPWDIQCLFNEYLGHGIIHWLTRATLSRGQGLGQEAQSFSTVVWSLTKYHSRWQTHASVIVHRSGFGARGTELLDYYVDPCKILGAPLAWRGGG